MTALLVVGLAATSQAAEPIVEPIVLADFEGDLVEVTRQLVIDADFIQLPLMYVTDAEQEEDQRFTIEENGKVLRFTRLPLAKKNDKPDLTYSYDVREFRGREVVLRFKSDDPSVLDRLKLSDEEVIDPAAYRGPHRPQFHFSPRMGWMNDVNGPYYLDGLYHLFYQANPTATGKGSGGIKYWAHSVSKDLVHWEEWPIALFPDAWENCYSGSAILVHQRIPGLNDEGPLPTPALFFTASFPTRMQHLATTADQGRTWQRFAGNPVVTDTNRDPKVLWHEPSQRYVMLLYVNPTGDVPEGYRIYNSKNLTDWEIVGHIPHWYECPDLIQMKSPLTGKDVWLLYGTWRDKPRKGEDVLTYHSAYQLGEFDGTSFKPISEVRPAHLGPQFYGALTFENDPKGRHIMMGWARGTRFPGEPFQQCATVPLRMQLKLIDGKDMLCFEPAEELEALRGEPLLELHNITTAEANARLASLTTDQALDVTLRFKTESDAPVRVTMRELEFVYEPSTGGLSQIDKSQIVSETTLHPEDSVEARFLIDRGIIESFWNGGEAAFSRRSLHTDKGTAFAIKGDPMIQELRVYPVANIWEQE